jgi:hypothetical protein
LIQPWRHSIRFDPVLRGGPLVALDDPVLGGKPGLGINLFWKVIEHLWSTRSGQM